MKIVNYKSRSGFTLAEFIIVIMLISIFVTMTLTRLAPLVTKNSFRGQVQDFISTMQMAASAAAESSRRYEVTVDLIEQTYTLRQITNPDLEDVLNEDIITFKTFNDNCRMIYVVFDDLVAIGLDTERYEQQIANFRVGKAGWQSGAKVVFMDNDENLYSVVVNRISRLIELRDGDVAMLLPKNEQDIQF
ncbi:MAG: prepilin-type N-terminal cleavage/methylation domain-containing protein [Phycisphaerae bacterium]|nr:prepilin-type N-terminal cleavage/methylation domain-containing protein [Phycisphaerae bacterium]